MVVADKLHRFTVAGRRCVYDADSGGLFELDPVADRTLQRCLTAPPADGRATDETSGELQRARLLTAALPSAVASDPFPDLSSVPVSTLIAVITWRCNLVCTYCYARHGRDRGPVGMMTRETGRQAIDFLLAHAGRSPSMHVTFFGGEPLMNAATMKDMVTYGRRCAEENGREIHFSLTTNGTCFTPDLVRFLDRERVAVVVSLDGPPTVHDRHRVFGGGAGSYRVAADGVKRLLDGYAAHPVKARVTVTRHALELTDIFFHLHRLGFHEIGFSPVSTTGSDYALRPEDFERFVTEFRRLIQAFLGWATQGRLLGVGNLIGLLSRIHHGEDRSHPCGAGLGLMAVDPLGSLAFCHRFVGHEAFTLGDLTTGLHVARRSTLESAGRRSRKAACETCWARRLCAGGCHYDAWLATSNLAAPDPARCRFIRAMLDACLSTYVRLSRSAPGVLTRLLDVSPNCRET